MQCLPLPRIILSLIPRFGTFTTNLLTIPSTIFGFCTMFLVTLLSETVNERALVSMIEDLWGLPFLVAIYCLPENPNQWVYFVRRLLHACSSSSTSKGPRIGLVIVSVRSIVAGMFSADVSRQIYPSHSGNSFGTRYTRKLTRSV